MKKWDQVIANATIWILQLVAAADQTAFVNDYFHCVEVCDSLNSGSYSRNVAYAVFAWLLWYVRSPTGELSSNMTHRCSHFLGLHGHLSLFGRLGTAEKLIRE